MLASIHVLFVEGNRIALELRDAKGKTTGAVLHPDEARKIARMLTLAAAKVEKGEGFGQVGHA